ncbi:hypothetical protein PoB_001496100 [Plakobranchus ocellatus]|uniref:Uncharacterized protein n=1 Tax=Plakobranchus ocellatus TaxID=259542 RepID=A0AAV3YY35_9GAST|nr:hypothetical protein PoB_001496100 [Plakobranchus ocellatus]
MQSHIKKILTPQKYKCPSAKKADAGVISSKCDKRFKSKRRSCCRGDANVQSGIKDGMLRLASGKAILRGEIGGREVDVIRHSGREGVVVRKELIEEVS